MTDQHLDDDQLTADLQRRAEGARLAQDWARRELLPSINAAIETRPQRVVTSRGPAFAGLAGVVAILLVLVVAVPRLSSPGSTEQPVAQATPTVAPPLILPEVMSAQEFAVGVLTGRLLSSTVLVDGTIGVVFQRGPACVLEICLMGRLEDTDPSVDVMSRWIATVEGPDAARREHPGFDWQWWQRASAPVTGTLVLAVDAEGTVELLGHSTLSSTGTSWTVAELFGVQPRERSVSQVHIVEAFLVDNDLDRDTVCADVLGLPLRECPQHPTDALAGARFDPESGTVPALRGTVAVQGSASEDFRSGAAYGHYAIAPRLYGGGCDAEPPCWLWDVVGRVSGPAAPEPSATAASKTFTCGPTEPPDVHANLPSATWTGITLIDETGLVERCEAWEVQSEDSFPMTVANQNGDPMTLEFTWAGACESYGRFTFSELASGFELVAASPMPINVSCDGMVFSHGLRLHLHPPVLADTVSTRITRAPAVTLGPRTQSFECVGPPLPPGTPPYKGPLPVVIDETGLIDSCLQTDVITELTGTISVSNPFEDNAIEVVWANGPCDPAIEFTFRADDDGYSIVGDRPSACPPGLGEPLPIYIRFSQPMPAESIAATLDGIPCDEFDRTDMDPQLPAPAFVDETGLVGYCFSGNLPWDNHPIPILENGDDLGKNLLLSWVGTSCETEARVTFARAGERFALTVDQGEDKGCVAGPLRRVILYLSEPVDEGLIDLTFLPDGWTNQPSPASVVIEVRGAN